MSEINEYVQPASTLDIRKKPITRPQKKNPSGIAPLTALEGSFPFEAVSDIAEIESWRKEVYRPVYHTHKWWAQRLGSVFRALLIGANKENGDSVMEAFYSKSDLTDFTVFDPFMGSGTTVGEALKLGFRAIGRDINPVSAFAVSTALRELDRAKIEAAFSSLEATVGKDLLSYFEGRDSKNRPCEVLYYFWVKTIDCPECSDKVDLFSSYIFARHAYTKKYPRAQALCPHCDEIIETRYDTNDLTCTKCKKHFNPQIGPARHQTAVCNSCEHEFSIVKTVRALGSPPKHRMYAKLVLTSDGKKEYLPITSFDQNLFDRAKKRLSKIESAYPTVAIEPGHNTNQAMNYCYRHWHEMFNARQLLGMYLLGTAIAAIKDEPTRNALFSLFSGALEFNNMFASYKGEGTGAVRHMFSHHVLKPERTPLEANLWGTPKSSGAFSTLFDSRILRALDYRDDPFEIRSGEKVYGLNQKIGSRSAKSFDDFKKNDMRLYVSCGSSAQTDISDSSIDLVLTDPPFFDNVHYSELADFFYVWQKHFNVTPFGKSQTTRHPEEVQQRDPNEFAAKLGSVFSECRRVLKNNGILAFSYHHSREEGWTSVADAVWNAGFRFTAAFPVKAEMSVAAPKAGAKEPIDLDIILVCRKQEVRISQTDKKSPLERGEDQVRRFWKSGRKLSRNDIKIILMGQVLVRASEESDVILARNYLQMLSAEVSSAIERLVKEQK